MREFLRQAWATILSSFLILSWRLEKHNQHFKVSSEIPPLKVILESGENGAAGKTQFLILAGQLQESRQDALSRAPGFPLSNEDYSPIEITNLHKYEADSRQHPGKSVCADTGWEGRADTDQAQDKRCRRASRDPLCPSLSGQCGRISLSQLPASSHCVLLSSFLSACPTTGSAFNLLRRSKRTLG